MKDVELKPETTGERRHESRWTVDWPGKIYVPDADRYVPCHTCNLSTNGAMLRLDRAANIDAGATILIGIACKRRQTLLRRAEMRPATVLRTLKTADGRCAIAVQFHRAANVIEHRQAA